MKNLPYERTELIRHRYAPHFEHLAETGMAQRGTSGTFTGA